MSCEHRRPLAVELRIGNPLTSAFGTKRTSRHAQPMSAFGGKADIFTTLKQWLISDCNMIILPQNHRISKSFYGAYDPNQSSNEKPICASLDASGSLSTRRGKAGSRA